jgi:hypothetical protein
MESERSARLWPGPGAATLHPDTLPPRARATVSGSSIIPNSHHRQLLEPLFAIINSDDCAPTAFSSSQPTLFDFRVSRRPSDTVALAKLPDAHRPLPRPALSFSL